jgi:hypothetical protein
MIIRIRKEVPAAAAAASARRRCFPIAFSHAEYINGTTRRIYFFLHRRCSAAAAQLGLIVIRPPTSKWGDGKLVSYAESIVDGYNRFQSVTAAAANPPAHVVFQ